MNIFVLDRNYRKIGVLSNQGANPKAPYFDDLYTQELDTGADTYYFSTLATYYAQDIIEIGNHVVFEFNNKQKMFVISSLEFEHRDGMNVIGVYAEGAGFELLEMYKKDIKIENCTYAQLLDNILAGTGWKYKVSSSLSKETRDVDYTQEKNVYALLQDSIQTFQGVELEFITDYRDGSPVKTIRAYGNGERGTFVGKRFEYGKNVKGIVKTQEVSDVKDENVIFNEGLIIIDGLRVEVTYDVDFALRSEEVTELNIGDTHYIIDNDFNPPMNIKGRIGKIEISFSDPTRNKIYIANFKKATGSDDDDLDEEDVKDIIDDYLDDKYGDGADHDHCRLISKQWDEDYCMTFGSLPGLNTGKTGNRAYFEFRDYDVMFSVSDEYKPNHWLEISLTRSPEFVGSDFEPGAGNDDCHGAYIYNSSGDLIPESDNRQFIGRSDKRWHEIYAKNLYAATSLDTNYVFAKQVYASDMLETYTVQSPIYFLPFDRKDMIDVNEINDSSEVSKQDLLDFILNDIKLHEYMHKEEDADNKEDGLPKSGTYLGLLSEDYMDHRSDLDCDWKNSKVAKLIMREMIYSDSNNNGIHDGGDAHETHVYNLPALVVALIGAFQQHVENGGEDGGSNPGDGGLGIPEGVITYTEDPIPGNGYRLDFNADRTYVNDLLIANDGMNVIGNLNTQGQIVASNGLDVYGLGIFRESLSVYKGLAVHNGSLTVTNGNISAPNGNISCKSLTVNGKEIDGNPNLDGCIDVEEIYDDILEETNYELHVRKLTYFDHSILFTGKGGEEVGAVGGGYNSIYGVSRLEAMIINCDTWSANEYWDDISFLGNIIVDGTITHKGLINNSDISKKENIRYINNQAVQKENLETRNYSDEDLLEKADLHDFIVNQVNICEYNFIGDTANKIGFIANDYEGTKVGDKIVSKQEFKERNDDGEVVETYESLVYDADNLLFATIGALQEEVRIKDEKIASLEARLAKIEEMLGINNN